MLGGVNDAPEHARRLAEVLDPTRVQGEPDPVQPDRDVRRLRAEKIGRFKAVLDAARLPSTVRLTRGRDIAAACGQLAATA